MVVQAGKRMRLKTLKNHILDQKMSFFERFSGSFKISFSNLHNSSHTQTQTKNITALNQPSRFIQSGNFFCRTIYYLRLKKFTVNVLINW